MIEKKDNANNAKLKVIVNDLEALDFYLILHAKNIFPFPNVWGTKVAGAVLEAPEFCDFGAQTMMLPPSPPPSIKKCDG